MATPQAEQTVFWNFKKFPGIMGVVVRGAGLAILLLPLLTDHLWTAWLSIPIWFTIWVTASTRRVFMKRNLQRLPKVSAVPGEARELNEFPKVTIIAPGRNEEEGVEEAARSLAKLDYPNVEIFCINDHSTDRTGEILNQIATDHPQVRVIHDPPLQTGWQGKSNAIWYAVHRGDPQAKWLLLTDADVVFDPQALRQGIAAAEEAEVDFITCIPFLETGTFVEELVLPIQWGSLVAGSSPNRLNNPETRPVGIGAFILVKREAYLGSGGHSAFYAQQPEDALLALAVRMWGGTLGVGWTDSLFRVRLYRGYKQLMSYWVRKNRIGGDDRIPYFCSMLLFWFLTLVAPFPFGVAAVAKMIAFGHFHFGLAVYALGAIMSYVEMSKALDASRAVVRMRRGIGWLHPLAGLLRVWVELKSLGGALAKRPMDWRGRHFVNVRSSNSEKSA